MLLPYRIDTNTIILLMLGFLAFAAPFGMWQEHIFFGMTAAKITIPLASLLFAGSFIMIKKQQTITFYKPWLLYIIFIVLASPTLIGDSTLGHTHFLLFCGYAALMFLVFNICKNTEHIKFILLSFLLGLSVIMSVLILAYSGVFDLGVFFDQPVFEDVYGLYRLLGTEKNPNAFAVFFIVALPAIFAIATDENNRLTKLLWISLGILFLIALSMTASRSAALGAFSGVAVIWYLKNKITWQRTMIFVFLLPLCFIAAFKVPEFIVNTSKYAWVTDHNKITVYWNGKIYTDQQLLLRDKQRSTRNRIEFIPVAWDIMKHHPVSGIAYDKMEEELTPYTVSQNGPHNIILYIGVYFGIPALIAFAAFLICALLHAFKSIIKIPIGEERTIYASLLAIMTGILINGLFHSGHINSLFWLVIALNLTTIKLAAADTALSITFSGLLSNRKIKGKYS